MSNPVLEVEGVSKRYRLGAMGTGSFRQDLKLKMNAMLRKKNDAFFKEQAEQKNNSAGYIQALDNINFQINAGDAFGIIGGNGSGKSTLLKILARIIHPTTGKVRGTGRVNSILEVGTGFHHELTGRENLYLSGYTLGMNKAEINKKFEEIVAFSGVEKFLDTPVKRYSSGMYVRLAFAVAAHLEPDILIVDEVLAVGDAEFQKKCLGKMHEVSTSVGRTILFVSHNMQAISNLCNRVIWIQQGKLIKEGSAKQVVQDYITNATPDLVPQSWNDPETAPGNELIRLKSVFVKPLNDESYFSVNTPVLVTVDFWNYITDANINVNVALSANTGECIFNLGSETIKGMKAIITLRVVIPGNLLNNKLYHLSLTVVKNHSVPVFEFADCAAIEIEDDRKDMHYFGTWPGLIRPQIDNNLYIKDYI